MKTETVKSETLNIYIAGVGGQGTLLASRVLGAYAVLTGKDCKLSEVHGMAQRGGSVVTHVRIGAQIFSPIVAEGTADVLLAFEQLEGLRAAYMLKKDGLIIVNTQKILPSSVTGGTAVYPDDALDRLQAMTKNFAAVDANALAAKAGNVKAANTVMLGALCKKLGLDLCIMKKALESTVPSEKLEVNAKALEMGYNT